MQTRVKFLYAFSVICILIGIIFIVVGKVKETYEADEGIVTIIDAGGSGTRLKVYKLLQDELTSDSVKCEDTGLGNYAEEEYPTVVKKLEDCYEKGHEYLPKGAITPIWFGATAGMRILRLRDNARYNKIWTMVNATLNTTDYIVKWSDTFPGNYEARFSWIAANVLKKTLKTHNQVGMTELGSSSLQMAFPVDNAPSDDEHITELQLNGIPKLNLYEYSYLCYGEAEIFRKVQAQLVKNANFGDVVEDPCSFKNYNWTRDSEYLWSVPCVKGDYAKEHFGGEINGPDNRNFTLVGTGDPEKCLDLLRSIITVNCTSGTECGMEDVSQPQVRGKYLALASFYYTTDYIGVPYNGNKDDLWQKAKDICETSYNQLTPPYAETSEKYKSKYCVQSVTTYFLLSEGFKFDDANWDIEFTKDIDGTEVGWTLGAAYYYQNEAYKHKVEVVDKGFRAMFIIGILVTIISVILLVIAIVMSHKEKSYESLN